MKQRPLVSIIVPMYNAAPYLERCFTAIRESSYSLYEIIVVDDCSTDNSLEISRKNGAMVFQLPRQSGPSAARNYGADRAQGDILFFVDSDVLIQKDAVERVVGDFAAHPDIVAVFGSYDRDPAEKNFISQYKNLLHHFVHQQSSSEAVTFWAACGAVRKEIFHAAGGFNQSQYKRPCIEDIELGHRIKRMGYRILLDKELQVKHLKGWRLKSLLYTDIFCRAVPWTRLILESKEMPNDLNLQTSQKISAGLVGLIILMLPLSVFMPELIYCILFLLAVIFIINHKFFIFFLQRKGFAFLFPAFAMHLLYYSYSGLTFVVCWILHKIQRLQ
jgi:glycosyltransferase involved in cell wall biosynthesis